MRAILAACVAVAMLACHDSERYSPTAPPFQNALTVSPVSGTLAADGFSTLAITAQVSSAADPANRRIEFTTSDGSWVESASADAKTIEKPVDAAGRATVHLRASQRTGTNEVTVKVKGRDDLVKSVRVEFVAADPEATLRLTAERTSAPADDFTPTAIFAQLGPAVPQSGRSVKFTTTHGKFLQSGNNTAIVTADHTGRARADLVGTQVPALARVTAEAFTITREVLVQFVPAPPDSILVKPAKLTLRAGFGAEATTSVTIEMHRTAGKTSIGIVPNVRVVDPADGRDLQFLIRGVSPSTAAGTAQAEITAGATPFRGLARIEVRVEGSTAVGTALIEIVSPPA